LVVPFLLQMKINESTIRSWEQKKILTSEQAQQLKTEIRHTCSENSSTLWMISVSTIGAVLLGIAALLFISSNWEELNRFEKMGFAFSATFFSFFFGVFFQHLKSNLPGLGSVLIFLSTILFGGAVAVVSQVYHLTGPPYGIFLLWALGIAPVVYVFYSRSNLRVFLLVLIAGLILFLNSSHSMRADFFGIFNFFDVFLNIGTMIVLGSLLYAVGTVHKLLPKYEGCGIIYRLWGLKIVFFFLFWLTFGDIFEAITQETVRRFSGSGEYFSKVLFLSALSAGLMLITYFKTLPHKKSLTLEYSFFGINLALVIAYVGSITFWSAETSISGERLLPFFVPLFNIVFICGMVVLLYESFKRENIGLLNFTLFAIGVFIFGKYIQFFEDLLEGSLFFFVGGVVLLISGIFLEWNRRLIREKYFLDS
jgi:uncharacterized membrane protein